MDTRLLKRYEEELAFVREMGAEFAAAYPKIAARLGIEGFEVLDPYVERLYESFAFLAARVQLELDLQYPAFTQHLLEIVYPHYLAPVPSMIIAQFKPDTAQGDLAKGYRLPRGTRLTSRQRPGEDTACLYRTAHELTLWPVEIADAAYVPSRGDLVAMGIGANPDARAAIRLRLRHASGGSLAELPLDRLELFLPGAGPDPWRLYETILRDGLGLAARSTNRRSDWSMELGEDTIAPVGFEAEEALLPTPRRSFDGYRLLQEYHALPQRFFFARLSGLAPALQRAQGAEVDLFILLAEGRDRLADTVTAESFALHCSPAINLFEKRCDRVRVDARKPEQHVVADRTAPLDFELHSLKSLSGIRGKGREDIEFRPFYSADDLTAAGETHEAYYALRRRMRQRSETQRLKGTRTSYLGSEVFVSLVYRKNAPWPADVEQLAPVALCTNRDLPIVLSVGGGETDFTLPEGGPISSVRALHGPTRPHPSFAEGDTAWRIVSHLTLNYLSIADEEGGGPAGAALRELLGIYVPIADRATAKQLEGIVSVSTRPIIRRIRERALSTPVRGLEVKVGFDESFFEGTGVYLLGAVLERFFAQYVALNSFTETVIQSRERGEIARWPAKSGRRVLV